MKIEECKEGMRVLGRNMFGLVYSITKVNKATVCVEYRSGEKVMRGGKWIDEVFAYADVRPSTLKPANIAS